MRILVLGGAGYIGSHTVKRLVESGYETIVVDNLQTGHQKAVDARARLHIGDVRDTAFIKDVLEREQVDTVIHFAADSLVGESMKNPLKYYKNNVGGAISLVEAMKDAGVGRVVFSSTAAVYGQPEQVPIKEDSPAAPTNTYGETKLAMERLFHWADVAYGIRFISLRYFNACGADPDGIIGEDHSPETHLVPLILQVAGAKREKIDVYGTDYPTADGTCIRDYIHVNDLADAHILAAKALKAGGRSNVYNLGNATGFSVRQVIETARAVTGRPIPSQDSERRAGDPAVLVASNDRVKSGLGWQPALGSLEEIIKTAWAWHSTHPDGYKDK